VGEALLIRSKRRSRSWRLPLAIATFGESTRGYDGHANSLMLFSWWFADRRAVVPPGNQVHLRKTVDILMMVLLDGREPTEFEFRDLFAGAGLETDSRRTDSFASIHC
jgi:hypothetical protein